MEIKDVLHFYVGQWVTVTSLSGSAIGAGFELGRYVLNFEMVHYILSDHMGIRNSLELRRLSDMTEEEGIKLVGHQSSVYTQVEKVASSNHCFRFSFEYTSSRRRREWTIDYNRLNPEQFHYLLKQGFDLFGLCDAGLAIDNKSL